MKPYVDEAGDIVLKETKIGKIKLKDDELAKMLVQDRDSYGMNEKEEEQLIKNIME